MTESTRRRAVRSRVGRPSRGRLSLVAVAFLILSRPVMASTVYVDCVGHAPGTFDSINAALGSLTTPPAVNDWHYVLLRSDCKENVAITGGRRVWIAPDGSQCPYAGCTQAGPPLRIASAAPGQDVVSISGPQDVTLVHLVLSGGGNGLSAVGNAKVTTFDVTAEDNTGAGMVANQGASISVNEGGARGNGYYGIVIGQGATGSLQGQAPWLHGQPVAFANNRGGIRVDHGSLVGAGGILVEGNAGPGLASFGGDVLFGAFIGETVIQNNAGGLFFSEMAHASLWRSGTGAVFFRNNGAYGVYVEKNSHATLFDVVVEGHAGVGVDAVLGSQVSLQGTHVRGNGPASGPGGGGLRVDGSSHAYIEQAEIVDNRGPGVLADLNSTVDARAAVVSGNHREGFRLRAGSFLALEVDGSLGTNGGPPVTCDLTSHVVSNRLFRSRACWSVSGLTQPRPVRPPSP